MFGHALWLNLTEGCKTFGSIRGDLGELGGKCPIFNKGDKNIIDGIDVLDDDDLEMALDVARADVVVNCVGVVKQLPCAKFSIPSISLNALFPQRLAEMCTKSRTRLIHISTDCVFSGNKGNYAEGDIPDAHDLYGRTKYLGEVAGDGCLTIRTSVVGRQLSGETGLFEWFLSQKGMVRGYRRAVFSGLTTYALADIIRVLINDHPTLCGLYHVSSEPINKYDLLNRLKDGLRLDVEVIPDDSVVVDRSLDSTKFREVTHAYIPTWPEMIDDFVKWVPNYEKWRF